MKKLTNIFFILLIWTSVPKAQVPGYQGKKFFIEIGGSFFPNLFYPTAQNKGAQSFPFGEHTGHFTIKDRYSLSLHYIIGRKSTFKAAYNYQVSGMMDYASTPGLISGTDEHTLFYQLHMHDVNLGFNLFGKRNINLAPMGFYWDLGIRMVFIDGILRDQRVDYADNRPDNTPYPDQVAPLNEETSMFMFGITGMWGYRAVIANRMTLTFGIETTIFPQYPLNLFPFIIPFMPSPGNSLTDFQRSTVMCVQDRYLLSLHIGIGVLIF
ncbi:MAG: hypothetical protein MK207_13140 [Saprospiraceae bacterium]|nr:hypothetical protein [Saprospiraceae bacterium]